MKDLTHYWHRSGSFPTESFYSAVRDCSFVCGKDERLSDAIVGWDGSGSPLFDVSQISFNGFDNQSGETFSIERNQQAGIYKCCTQGSAYDLAVRCCLLILRHHLPEDIEISSDDKDSAVWQEAQQIVNEHLEWEDTFKLDAVSG